ncbi:MmcQ/YjbR family DNA-binding protein [Streptosporangium sp. G11]|uniref:MmcQ/YjbR family DNA-binding protein n=1 Tax=Streptosporangium sp. G11 TaxID=3436926 RepID=UPI003EBC6ED9
MDSRGVSPEEFLRMALALPEVELNDSREQWTGVKVRGKGFCYLSEAEAAAHVKTTREEQQAMIAENPEVFGPSWSGGRFGWVAVRLAGADPQELAELVTEAWRLTAPRRLVASFEARP